MRPPAPREAVLSLLAIAVAVSMILAWVALASVRDQGNQNAIATQALCALRHDLEQRVQASLDFLTTHPNGFAGISPKVLHNSIANQQSTIRALQILACP